MFPDKVTPAYCKVELIKYMTPTDSGMIHLFKNIGHELKAGHTDKYREMELLK